MTPIKTLLATIFISLGCLFAADLTATPAQASGYSNGYVNRHGYTWNNGYWWRTKANGDRCAFTRVRKPYWYCGRKYYRWIYRQQFCNNRYSTSSPYTRIDPTNDDALMKLLDIAAARDRVEGQMRVRAQKFQEFRSAAEVLGLQGNFGWQGYGMYYPAAATAGAYQQQYANTQYPSAQGSTVYGYTTVSDVYGDLDLNALYEQAIRLAQDQSKYAAEASERTQSLVAQQGAQHSRIAEIYARAQAARELAKATEPQPSSHTKESGWVVKFPGNGQEPVVERNGEEDNDYLDRAFVNLTQAAFRANCVKCHGGEKTEKNLDLTNLRNLTAAQAGGIVTRIKSDDPSVRMPPEGPRLTSSAIAVIEATLAAMYPEIQGE